LCYKLGANYISFIQLVHIFFENLFKIIFETKALHKLLMKYTNE